MRIARTGAELIDALAAARQAHGGLALVPTMGALHAGHLALLEVARAAAPCVAVSIFVNPAQFGPTEDFARYPREETADLEKLRHAGCDLVWLPSVAEMYPQGDATLIDMTGPALGWEGALRPGHFRGVATVVAKLFGQVRPDAAVFGEKDWQQLQVIRQLVRDLHLPVRVVGAAIVREPDGLAMSSRNRFLTAAERAQAPALYAALRGVRDAIARGTSPANALLAGRARLADCGFALDYLALVDGETLIETDIASAGARLIAAARLGSVRLLDNVGV
jgi:pantoate--beta-alanine ligase